MMKFAVSVGLLVLAGLVASHPTYEPDAINYHNRVGIPRAARIKAAEEAVASGARITGGSPADLGKYPWMGGLIIPLSSGYTSVCGSSLISNTKGITAAHCWTDGYQQALVFEVVLGSTKLFSGGLRISTTDVTVHEAWNVNTITNDIAIFLVGFVEFSATIRAINLPASADRDYVGNWAWAAGFGLQSDYGGIPTNQTLHHVSLQVVPQLVCRQQYGSTYVTADVLCTQGVGSANICSSDSGGPLAMLDGTPELIGVTSFGAGGSCERGMPSGFASTTYFLEWIKARM